MDYQAHKTYFETAYKTGTDVWTHKPTNKQVAKLTSKLKKGDIILELGSGRGLFAKHLAEIGFRVIGLDFESAIVRKANEAIKDWKLEGKVGFLEGDALNIPLVNENFDGACDFGLFENLYKEDWPQYVKEIHRILKPGGLYLNVSLSSKTSGFFEFHPSASSTREFEKYGVHYYFFEGGEIKNIFKTHFEVVSQEVKPTEVQRGMNKLTLIETLFKKI
ncbi:hypothetical protein A2738_02645 [Candidatus Nomurabacteria bacterium RIFCSPHIGHO2_01_FULL_42_15]|uniref:Methyltransferase domain-containing protein n=1 Tax=Candidatus Nomurabacteria bacterium RIFCSPHIGHO2_01_FULL_42_15 TaxID=1801742 RepID=A0A1F6VEN9_9BACT|nr:MAG: hypothetical protein A2738_02645 [Candidatus Nomurabacteria bacterium RIFCSPHIGHO2_01_FULL_42_15]OGI92772.1 MAG: hypothetical protein A3A99_02710 [Candidatus Nomurabacteria bacterium RIFCSPLOWO2_01_FULL_41_18]